MVFPRSRSLTGTGPGCGPGRPAGTTRRGRPGLPGGVHRLRDPALELAALGGFDLESGGLESQENSVTHISTGRRIVVTIRPALRSVENLAHVAEIAEPDVIGLVGRAGSGPRSCTDGGPRRRSATRARSRSPTLSAGVRHRTSRMKRSGLDACTSPVKPSGKVLPATTRSSSRALYTPSRESAQHLAVQGGRAGLAAGVELRPEEVAGVDLVPGLPAAHAGKAAMEPLYRVAAAWANSPYAFASGADDRAVAARRRLGGLTISTVGSSPRSRCASPARRTRSSCRRSGFRGSPAGLVRGMSFHFNGSWTTLPPRSLTCGSSRAASSALMNRS